MAKLMKSYKELMNIFIVTGIFIIFASVMTGILSVIMLEGSSRVIAYRTENSLNSAAAATDSGKHASAAASDSSPDIHPSAEEKPASNEMTIPVPADSYSPAAAAEIAAGSQTTGEEAGIIEAQEIYNDNSTKETSNSSSNEKRDDEKVPENDEENESGVFASVTEVKLEAGMEKKQPNTDIPPSNTDKLPSDSKKLPDNKETQENKPVVTDTATSSTGTTANVNADKDAVTASGTNNSSPAMQQPGT